MNRTTAIQYIAHCLDDALAVRQLAEMPNNARLIGYQCGYEPLFIAVWSYLPGITLNVDEAEEIARDYLTELGWFADCENPPSAEYTL